MMKNNIDNKLVFFCKTYIGDIIYFKNLINSYNLHNKDNIKLYVSVPLSDIESFMCFSNKNIIIITDESYAGKYLTNEYLYNHFSPGYINQQICKLSFWETGFCDNYLCLDSETYFIKDFYIKDFMHDETTPYIVLTMDKDLYTSNEYKEYADFRQKGIKLIYDKIDLKDLRYRTCHNSQIFNAEVLKSFKYDFLAKNNLTYLSVISYSPLEFTWYNAWFQKCNLVKEYAIEPIFKNVSYQNSVYFFSFKFKI